MTTINPQLYRTSPAASPTTMQAPPLDKEYDYYHQGNSGNGASPNNSNAPITSGAHAPPHQRVKKGLGAMPMEQPQSYQQEQRQQQQQQQQLYSYQQQQRQQQEQQQTRIVSPGHHSGGMDPPASNEVLIDDEDDYYEDDDGGDDDDDHEQYIHDQNSRGHHEDRNDEAAVDDHQKGEDGDEALLDLEQLEELHHEAERMKALGNKHMAAQEYTRAYNAYSAALQLSPVGPSSHVFLSNRSAALLSLKRYSAAATDARRAIALAPTFGKAHARLGQSLYFLKDYDGAVSAYEDAIHYEPENPITKTYLEKARTKQNRQREKAAKNSRGEEVSVLTAESSVQQTVVNSVATDPNASAAVVQTKGFRGQSRAIANAVGGGMLSNGMTTRPLVTSPPDTKAGISATSATGITTPRTDGEKAVRGGHHGDEDDEYNQDDPDFDEALRIQERANRYLANKNYKSAIEEYTAALFLVPDDENLSPELHLGRAHALNGSRRHESAKIDSQLALKIKPTPEAYSTLAKSLFYMKDYEGSIVAFGKCKDMLAEGESLSMFDRAYLQKAEAALQEYSEEGKIPSTMSRTGSAPVPKLKPPKFVSREEALNRTPQMPTMPRQWPQQSPRDNKIVKYGEEREVLFLSEALGIKLNRGRDGIVRVIEVSPDVAGSPIAREGNIEVGDVVREAAGVDIRRPITNIMWGDTVALIKMAPRPIVFVVAKELTKSIMDQRKLAAQNALSPTGGSHFFPSNSSTEESVRKQMEERAKQQTSDIAVQGTQVTLSDLDQQQMETMASVDVETSDAEPAGTGVVEYNETVGGVDAETVEDVIEKKEGMDPKQAGEELLPGTNSHLDVDQSERAVHTVKDETEGAALPPDEREEDMKLRARPDTGGTVQVDSPGMNAETPIVDLREEEARIVGGEIMFVRTESSSHSGWDNLRWMAYSGVRKVKAFQLVYRFYEGRTGFLWSKDQFELRYIAVYENPNLILILRKAHTVVEFRELMDLPKDADIDEKSALRLHLFVESVVDPKTCKLRLSPLTTVTSILPDVPKESVRRRSCLELITPFESVVLTAVMMRKGPDRPPTNFTDSGAFLEASGLEFTLAKCICGAHDPHPETANDAASTLDLSWKHQIILGTLHSYVVIGNQSFLDLAISEALHSDKGRDNQTPHFLNSRIVDAVDEGDKTALHYACLSRFSSAVLSLVKVGANVDIRIEPHNMTPCHICAMNLDFKSLEAILAINRRPNVVDALGRTPLYLAISEGRAVGGVRSPDALDKCISVMEKYGAEVDALMGHCHPVCYLAARWDADELGVVLGHCTYKYPIRVAKAENVGISMSARYQYPVHAALVSLRQKLKEVVGSGSGCERGWHDCAEADDKVNKTIKVLFSFGFEPNERLEAVVGSFPERGRLMSYVGFAPIQIVAAAALDVLSEKHSLSEELFSNLLNLLVNVSEVLVRNGARLSLEVPPLLRSPERVTPIAPCDSDGAPASEAKKEDRSGLKIPSNKDLMQMFGSPRMTTAQKYYKELKPAAGHSRFVFHCDKNQTIENSLAPGGSDDKTCAVCWKPFGMLVRKHRCRTSVRFVCDECSSHRILADGEEHRVSDGQFLLAHAEEIRDVNRKLNAAVEHERMAQQPQRQSETLTQRSSAATTAARLRRVEEEEESNRDSLFGGIIASVANSLTGSDTSTGNAQTDAVSGLSSQLNQTRDQLNERGDKLNTLAEKSDKLVSASKDFAAMAKELNRTSNQGFFGW